MGKKASIKKYKSSVDYCVGAKAESPPKIKYNEVLTSGYFKRFYAIVVAISIIFASLGIVFIHYAEALGKADTSLFIQRATEQTKFAVEEHIKEEFITLLGAAVIAEKQHNLTIESYVLKDVISGLFRHNAFEIIGFSDSNGLAVWVDRYNMKQTADLSDEDFIRQSLAGHNTFIESHREQFGRSDVVVYSVPVYNDGSYTVRGVLFAVDPADELRNIVEHSLYAGTGMAHIIDKHGQYMLKSHSPLSLGIGNSIFELSTPLDKKIQNEISDNLMSGKDGHHELYVNGETRMVSYEPLSVNEWFVFYSVPEKMVSAGMKKVTTGAITVFITSVLVFLLLIIWVHYLNNKNRRSLEMLAFVDHLTGQRNYQKFLADAAEILQSSGEQYAVCYCDIKGFKYINDLFGRDVGDRLLQYWSNYFCEIMLEGELSGRVSGDIFVYLLKYTNRHEIETRYESAAQMLAVFPETLMYGYRPEMYGGVFINDGRNAELSLDDMLDRANMAHKKVKEECGIGRLGFYSDEMREQKLWESEVMSKMESALENGEFQLYFQPKINIQNGDELLGAEALVRWLSADYGLVTPNRFIEIFEKNGFIIKLDRYIFERVCQYYNAYLSERDSPACILSVNVSRLELMQADFVRQYSEIKEKYNIPDNHIELEFTESLVFQNHLLFRSIVSECKRHGFLCSLDDFGADYSSLNILKSIQVDVLKLDGLFFERGNNAERGREIVKNIIAMAKALNMKTVAEGVDQPEQVDQLREMGCDAVQGYVFSKPMPQSEFVIFMSQHGMVTNVH